jgi:hypothetical protein
LFESLEQWNPIHPSGFQRHCSSQSVKRSRSSVKVANTRTGFSSRPGGTATNTSRAPTSIPAAFDSNTGRSSKHIPLFRLRRLGFASRVCRLPPRVFFTGCSLSELQATAKLRIEDTLANGISWLAPTVNHCSAHGTWNQANDRRSNHTARPKLAYFRCLSLRLRMEKRLGTRQLPFRFAPTTGRACANERPSGSVRGGQQMIVPTAISLDQVKP